MQKLTSILAWVDQPEDALTVVAKASAIAAQFGARVELLERGDILAEVARIRPDLVLKAPTRGHRSRRGPVGASDWRLAQECPAPLMLVRERPWPAQPRFAAAVDISDDEQPHVARGIVHTAGFLAAGMGADLEILYSERELHEERVRMRRAVRLARLVREFHVGCEHIRHVEGAPEESLPALVSHRRYDVLVIGGESRRTGLARLRPGTADRTLDAFGGDIVLVTTPDPPGQCAVAARSLAGESAYQRQELL